MKFNEKAMRVHNISVGKDLSGRTRWCAPTMTLLTFLEPNCDFDAIALAFCSGFIYKSFHNLLLEWGDTLVAPYDGEF